MALEGFHLRVAQILGQATGPEGFALGGGYGLQSHHLADRPSDDLDSYVDKFDPEVFRRAEEALLQELWNTGLEAVVVKQDDVFRAILVTSPDGDEVVVDLGYDYRDHPPVIVEGIGPVLDVEDIVTGKVRAFFERTTERDYSDIDRILTDGRWTPSHLLAKAQTVFPELTARDFAEKLSRAHTLDRLAYARIGVGPRAVAQLQERLNTAGAELVRDRM